MPSECSDEAPLRVLDKAESEEAFIEKTSLCPSLLQFESNRTAISQIESVGES